MFETILIHSLPFPSPCFIGVSGTVRLQGIFPTSLPALIHCIGSYYQRYYFPSHLPPPLTLISLSLTSRPLSALSAYRGLYIYNVTEKSQIIWSHGRYNIRCKRARMNLEDETPKQKRRVLISC